MAKGLQEIKRRALQSQLETKLAQYEALSLDHVHELDAGRKVLLEKKLENLERDIEANQDLLDSLAARPAAWTPPRNAGQRPDLIRTRLPRIDFHHVVSLLNGLLDSPEDACACLLLFQQSALMGGRLCSDRIRELLTESTADFKYWTVQFHAGGGVNERALLDGLAGYLNLKPRDDLEQYAADVIGKICGSLQSGSIVMLEIRSWDYVKPAAPVVDWFLGFWRQLIEHLEAASANSPQVRLITTIFVDGDMPAECLTDERICSVDALDSRRMLQMQLAEWTEEEIRLWLSRYAQKQREIIDQITGKIWATTRGLPLAVEQALMNELGT